MPFITQGKANIKYLLIVVLVAAIGIGIIVASLNSFRKELISLNNFIEIKNIKQDSKTICLNTDAEYCPGGPFCGKTCPNCPFVECPTDENATYNVYRITIKSKQESSPQLVFLGDIIGKIINPSSWWSAAKIMYDEREGSPYESPLDFSYYILGFNPTNKQKDKYENEKILIDISSADKKLIPYLRISDYCEKDEDCTVRGKENNCNYGAFNYYQEWQFDWECWPYHYPQEDQKILDKICDPKTENIDIEYAGSNCIHNRCIPQGKRVKCSVRGEMACLSAGTMISMSNNSIKKIEEIQKGDLVKSFNLKTKEFKLAEVENIIQRKDPLVIINYNFKVAPDEVIYLSKGRTKKAIEIKVGDYLFNEQLGSDRVNSVSYSEEKVDTYDLQLKNGENFFANGVLVQVPFK